MKDCVLVTGGAGFIGTAVSSLFPVEIGELVVVDVLHPQVHRVRTRPAELAPRATLLVSDVAEAATWDDFLRTWRPRWVLHLAAETGTGQSLTEASRHATANVLGLTRMLDAFAARECFPEHVVLTSSRAVYGEGTWQRADGSTFHPGQRDRQMLARAEWDFPGARALPFRAGGTAPDPTSVYGATKLVQEQILRAWTESFGVKASILRLQNVYGPGQSLTNPYTGVVTLFARLAQEGKPIPLYEDGEMLRDFVYIDDVARAILLAFQNPPTGPRTVDIGSGTPITIRQAAEIIARVYGAPAPEVTGKYRHGDVRHASCEIDQARTELGYAPRVAPEEGLVRLCEWVNTRVARI
ncbi:MAG TPA: NAD-dependent epimerase/dehydratase family protein [Myxococcaceae bacterium]|nr:NAD-dependent epimerase/dehydratase family protein [Myxococcaceae bacterium]